MERMDKGDLLHIGTAYVEVHTFKGKDYVTAKDFNTTTNALSKEILKLEEENKKLKEWAEENSYLKAKNRRLEAENNKLNTRINTMQEFIDYSEGVVHNAIRMLYEEGGDEKALDYLENCYAVGDERQYEEMEKLDTED